MHFQSEQYEKLLMAILLNAIYDAKHGDQQASLWLASPYASELADLLGIEPLYWNDLWNNWKAPIKHSQENVIKKWSKNSKKQLIVDYIAFGYTQKEAANLAGIAYNTISKWKRDNKAFKLAIKEAKTKSSTI